MSATPSTTPTPAAPAAPAAPAINLDAGKDLTTLDDASLLSELGFESAPLEAASSSEPTPQELDDSVVNSVVDQAPAAPTADDQPTDDENATPGEPAAPAAEGTPTPEPAAAEKQLAAKFTVEDAEGELEIPDLRLTFEADGGKKFEKVSLDKVVRLAQQGIYNHRLQTEVTQARETQTRLSQTEAALETERQATQRAWSLAERLLTDQEFFDKTYAEYQDYNAPDAVIARQREEIESLRNRPAPNNAGPTAAQKSQVFFEQTAIPAISTIVQQSPTVSQQELLGQFMVLTAPLMVDGKIPSARFDDVSRLLVNELAPWAADLHEQRAAQETARQAAAKNAEKAKLAAVNSKRQLARVIKPAGRPAPDAPKPRTARDADDAASLVLQDVFAGR